MESLLHPANVLIMACTAILCLFLWRVHRQQARMFYLWWFLSYRDSLRDRVTNLHYGTEKRIDFSGWYTEATLEMGARETRGSFAALCATLQRVWRELGEKRTLLINGEDYTITVGPE